MAKIDSITFYWKDNYVQYSDTDITTDYYNSSTIGTNQMFDWVKEDGDDIIRVSFVNDIDSPQFNKRLEKLCKVCGYVSERRDETHTQSSVPGLPREWKTFDFILRRVGANKNV